MYIKKGIQDKHTETQIDERKSGVVRLFEYGKKTTNNIILDRKKCFKHFTDNYIHCKADLIYINNVINITMPFIQKIMTPDR